MRTLEEISYTNEDKVVVRVPYSKLKARLYEHIGEYLYGRKVTPKVISTIMESAEPMRNISQFNMLSLDNQNVFDAIKKIDEDVELSFVITHLRYTISRLTNELTTIDKEELEMLIGDSAVALGILAKGVNVNYESAINKSLNK